MGTHVNQQYVQVTDVSIITSTPQTITFWDQLVEGIGRRLHEHLVVVQLKRK